MNNMPLVLRLTLVAAVVAVSTRSLGETAAPVKLLRVPDGGIQPQAIVDGKGVLHLVYLNGEPKGCDVFYARREAGQSGFSVPLRVNSQPGSAIALGTVRGAQLALGRQGRVHAAWNGSDQAEPKSAGGAPMLYARLKDRGDGFEPQRNLMTSTRHLDGGGSVAADDAGAVYVVWHGHSLDGPQDEAHRAVFVARSTDDGQTFAPEHRASPALGGACSCCGLKAFVDARGRLGVLYRSADSAGNRDVTLLLSQDRGATFQARVLGPWRVPTCPMSTMALGQGPGDSLVAMWERQGQVYRTPIVPAQLDAAPTGLPPDGASGNRKHPVFAVSQMPRPRLLMAWTEGTAWQKGGSLAWECVDLGDSRKSSRRAEGVPVWSLVATVAEADGSFSIIY